jgi:tetratricopeptide (TPR) repeat protein
MIRIKRVPAGAFVLALLLAGAAAGQTVLVTNELRQKANEHYQSGAWKDAEKEYGEIVASEPENTGARYRHGIALLNLGRAKEAASEFDRAMKASPNAVFALAAARAEAAQGNKKRAFDMLEKVAEYGGANADAIEETEEFKAFRGDTDFLRLVEKADLAANPCKAEPAFRQFDFWLGEWDVRNPQGAVVASSSITRDLNGCVINEHYTTPNYSGKSMSVYDRSDGKWHQTWVDIKGVLSEYVGGIEEGKMVYKASERQNGREVVLRMTFTPLPDGSVRQFGEVSFDGGTTWTTRYDLKYTKK